MTEHKNHKQRARQVEQRRASRLENARFAFEKGRSLLLHGLREAEALKGMYRTQWEYDDEPDWSVEPRWRGHLVDVDLPSMQLARELRELGEEFDLLPKPMTDRDEESDGVSLAGFFEEDGE